VRHHVTIVVPAQFATPRRLDVVLGVSGLVHLG
jgi:hypothetical protein